MSRLMIRNPTLSSYTDYVSDLYGTTETTSYACKSVFKSIPSVLALKNSTSMVELIKTRYALPSSRIYNL